TFTVSDQIPSGFVGDDQRLSQVMANLLSNAVKFTPDGGRVALDVQVVSQDSDGCVLQVQVIDSGIGISASQQKLLFKSFQQAESSTSRTYGGTGLGLVISKRIIEMMGGTIGVESEPGKGSTFSFTVRLDSAREDELEATAGPSLEGVLQDGDYEADFTGYTVLLVDDMEINREIVLALLEPSGLVLDCAENGVRALELFTQDPERYDLVFMDIQMPEMDGLEATRQLRALDFEKARSIPIVAMTANVFKDDIEASLVAGMNDHIGKPLDYSTVIEKLNTYLPER
ncbi:MAG: response regulator, partial [Coriobacteriales bacterium]|nr:response regulator [Coriobacteriales bacterium]